VPQLLGWTTPGVGEGFLVLDRDGDGRITSGAEMFGNFTPVPGAPDFLAANAFRALAAYDDPGGDGDGWITKGDCVFSSLRPLGRRHHDGLSDPDELKALSDVGVKRCPSRPASLAAVTASA